MVKKYLLFMVILSMHSLYGAEERKLSDSRGVPLDYPDLTIVNRAPFSITVKWWEYTPKGRGPSAFAQEIAPGETGVIQLGTHGYVYGSNEQQYLSGIEYSPLIMDPSQKAFVQFSLNRPSPIVFTATTLADMLKEIYQLDVFYPSEPGKKLDNFRHLWTPQYLHPLLKPYKLHSELGVDQVVQQYLPNEF